GGPGFFSRPFFTLPMIILVNSATASRTSSVTALVSVISIWLQMRQARVGGQVRLPMPAHAPATPMKDITPSLASGVLFSIDASPGGRSTQSMVENTFITDWLIESLI